MHVRVRIFGKADTIVVVESKLTKIDQFRRIIKDKFDVDIKLQILLYGGKLLENGYTFHDYNIKLNDVIQLMVKIPSDESTEKEDKDSSKRIQNNDSKKQSDKEIKYEDAKSSLYAVGDLIDMKDKDQGAWFEGKIVRIVCDPDAPVALVKTETPSGADTTKVEQKTPEQESDSENTPPEAPKDKESTKAKRKSIASYFTKSPNVKKKPKDPTTNTTNQVESLLYKIQLDADEEDSGMYCPEKEIRPRAQRVIEVKDLEIGQKVMINYNTEQATEKGYWYDFTVQEIKKLRTSYELLGTLFLGLDSIPQHDTLVKVHDKIFAIEEVVPLEQRSDEVQKKMVTPTEKRSAPLNCLTCRDDEVAPCKDCGCYKCLGKENPEKIVLCDECNNGYHMKCLNPPLTELPEEDWYCPSCKRNPNDVIAPGAAMQTRKKSASKSNRDWGRGMACVGMTKTCGMPRNHFGPIPGIEVGMCWRYRIQLSESGVHRPPVSGIHGRDVEGAYSIVLSGGYEDDVDNGKEFIYSGSGGRDLSGNKRTAGQSCNQTLTRENRALARNCAVKEVSESGGDAGRNWKNGKPVRVVRSFKMFKHFPKYAPKEGIRYDGIYKVVKYYPEKGLSGFRVWKYLLRRDDPTPAPWERGAKQFNIIYPDGYLEAEAEKKALEEKNNKKVSKKGTKKRRRQKSKVTTESESEASPPGKKRKTDKDEPNLRKRGTPDATASKNTSSKSPELKIPDILTQWAQKKANNEVVSYLTTEEKESIKADTLNSLLWEECLEVFELDGKKAFVEHVSLMFLCIICQAVSVGPVTTHCLHTFCSVCLKLAFNATGRKCPCCREKLPKDLGPNERLKTALRIIMPGYDASPK